MDKTFQLRKHYEQTYYRYSVKGVFLCEKNNPCCHDVVAAISLSANSISRESKC
jgi:hypothetical protein